MWSAGKAAGEPWQGDSIALAAAYHRAGLSHWADSSPTAFSADQTVAGGDWKPPPPKLAVDCYIEGAAVILPYDCNLGTAERYTELWAKAFTKVSSVKRQHPLPELTPFHPFDFYLNTLRSRYYVHIWTCKVMLAESRLPLQGCHRATCYLHSLRASLGTCSDAEKSIASRTGAQSTCQSRKRD